MFAGLWGAVAGVVSGLFLEIIISRFREENKFRKIIEQGISDYVDGVPFPGALYACTIAVYCLEDSSAAAKQARTVFGKSYKADWNTLCRAAGKACSLNGDLLVECEASVVLKAVAKNKQSVPIKLIFKLLQICEFDWDSKIRGQKPSFYLAQLLDYTCANDELENAYHILGLSNNATIAQIKNAHRKLAAKYHPDTEKSVNKNNGKEKKDDEKNESSASSFMRIQNAYELICKSRK